MRLITTVQCFIESEGTVHKDLLCKLTIFSARQLVLSLLSLRLPFYRVLIVCGKIILVIGIQIVGKD